MTKQGLNSADIVIGLQKVRGKGVTEGVGGDLLGDSCLADGVVERALKLGFVKMITASLAGFLHNGQRLLRKYPLVHKFSRCPWVFILYLIIQKHPVITISQILFMQSCHLFNLNLEIIKI